MSLNPLAEVEYRYRLAKEHLDRASKLFSLKDWFENHFECPQEGVQNS